MIGIEPSLSGLLLVNKPSGPTSYDIIRWLKRQIKNVRIGHSGTLDPLASGLLILLLGRATKKQSSVMGLDKVYRFTLRFGQKTDSGDITGAVIETKPVPTLTMGALSDVARTFIGAQDQIPPMYSALKVKGVPLYKLARKGETVERKSRTITIHSLEILSIESETDVDMRVSCSSGTYIRTLVEDFAVKFGTVGTMSKLVRESIGPFNLSQSVTAEQMREASADELARWLQPVESK